MFSTFNKDSPQAVFVDAQQPRFMHRRPASDLETYTILGIVPVIGHILLAGFVIFGKARDVGRDQHAVAYLHRSDIKRGQQVVVSAQKSCPGPVRPAGTGRAFQAHRVGVSFEYRIRWRAREARDPTQGTGAA